MSAPSLLPAAVPLEAAAVDVAAEPALLVAAAETGIPMNSRRTL